MSEQYCEASPLAVSEHEEYIWMLQLQQPEQVVQHFALYKFNTKPELSLLKMSIKNVIEQHPDLNSRFIFSEDGDLNKTIDPSFNLGIHIFTTSTNQLKQRLSDFKNKPWNAETDPPLNSLIIQTEQDILLALLLHPILEESYQLNDIIEKIKNNYIENQNHSTQLQPILLETSEQTATNSPAPTSNDQNHDHQAGNALSQNEISQIILTEFRNILAEPEMTAEDDFFDFGGHSLLATRVIGYLQNRHGITLSFNDFFKSSTASALAQYALVKNATFQQNSHEKIEQAPLTFTQDFLWQAYSAFDFSPIYNLPFAIEFQDQIDENIFFQAFHDIVVRHVGLRTLFKIEAEKAIQSITPLTSLNQYKWFWSSSESQSLTLAEEATYKFDLSRELPIRIRFLKNVNGQQTLSFLVHHMVIDEWSLNSIMSDLKTAYYARLNQQTPLWDTPANSIHELAISQQKNGLNPEHIQYWKNMLQDATFGLDLKNPATSTAQMLEPKVEWLELKFCPETYQSISAFSRLHHSSIFSVIYTAIISALQKTGDLKEIVIGTSSSGRTNPHFFDTVGYLTTMVAHRTQFNPEQNFSQLLEKTSQILNESMAYADIPINHIQKALGLDDDAGLIFDVYIHIHSNNALNGAFKTPQGDVQYRQILPERHESMFGLHFEIMDNFINNQHELSLIVTYQAHRYPTIVVEQISQTIHDILTQLS